MLHHISDQPNTMLFELREPNGGGTPVVWAIYFGPGGFALADEIAGFYTSERASGVQTPAELLRKCGAFSLFRGELDSALAEPESRESSCHDS